MNNFEIWGYKRVITICIILLTFSMNNGGILAINVENVGKIKNYELESFFQKDPVTSPPICNQIVPYRVVTSSVIIPGEVHRIYFELCNNPKNFNNFEPRLQIKNIGPNSTDWENVNLTFTVWNPISENNEEWIYRGDYLFRDCQAIEGRFRLYDESVSDFLTNWALIEIQRLWDCGQSGPKSGVDLFGIGVLMTLGIFLFVGIYVVDKGRKKISSLPKTERYRFFVKIRNVSKEDIIKQKEISKHFRISRSKDNAIEVYRKDGRMISDDDFNQLSKLK